MWREGVNSLPDFLRLNWEIRVFVTLSVAAFQRRSKNTVSG